jgi:hypothetical protein
MPTLEMDDISSNMPLALQSVFCKVHMHVAVSQEDHTDATLDGQTLLHICCWGQTFCINQCLVLLECLSSAWCFWNVCLE